MSSEWRGFLCVSDIFGGNNNSLLDKAQQITMRNPCSHTMTIQVYKYKEMI